MANWYLFTTTCGADPLNSANYNSPQSNRPIHQGENRICAILADDNGHGCPYITRAIIDDMARALQYGCTQTRVLLRF